MKLFPFSTVLISFTFATCANPSDTESQTNEDRISSDTVASQPTTEITSSTSPENLYCFKGTIDDQYEIFLEFERNVFNKAVYLDGNYHYLSNEIGFELSGEETDGHVVLERKKLGEIAETFEFDLTDEQIEGTWQKGEAENKRLELNRVNQSDEHSGSFLYNMKDVASGEVVINSFVSLRSIEDLTIENDKLVSDGQFLGSFCGSKVYLNDDYQNDAGGHIDQVIFAHLNLESEPGENVGNSLLLIDCVETWESEYVEDKDIIVDLNDQYTCTVNVFNFEGGEMYEMQKLVWEGEGSAQVFYYDNRIVLTAKDRKEVVYFDPRSSTFVEH